MIIHNEVELGQLIGKVIRFSRRIVNSETYAEPMMKARVKSVQYNIYNDKEITLTDGVHKITVNYAEFDEYNKQFEQSNYYGKAGCPCLTAREAGYYNVVEDIYFGLDVPMEIMEDDFIAFVEDCKTYAIDTGVINQLQPFGLSKEALNVVVSLMEAAYRRGGEHV